MNVQHTAPFVLALGALLSLPAASLAAPVTTRVSVASDGTQANSLSRDISVSADGRYVAFYSAASNLVADDTNGVFDVFVRDTVTGSVKRVSMAADGSQADNICVHPAISADGRYVAFMSLASNLVPDDANGSLDIFVRDLQAGTTTRVSVASDGTEANGGSFIPAISGDGRYVVFDSQASNLVADDTNGVNDIFVRDLQTGTTTRVSVATDGTEANDASNAAAISADGTHVAFVSAATNLTPNGYLGGQNVFLRDLRSGVTTLVSATTDGQPLYVYSLHPSLSADGRYVAFDSAAENLTPDDHNDATDVFLRDTHTGAFTIVSVASDGTQGAGNSSQPHVSADGRTVAFLSNASNLVPGDTNDKADLFVRNIATGTTSRGSVATDGAEADAETSASGISADGRYVAFVSAASNLVADDTNGQPDIFQSGPFSSSITPGITMPVGSPVKSSPTANDGVVYFGSDDGKLYAVHSADGSAVSGFPVDVSTRIGATVEIQSRPAVYYTPTGPYIYFTTSQGDICRLTLDGTQLYHNSDWLGAGITGTPAVTPDGMVYAALSTPTRLGAIILNPDLSTNTITLSLSYTGGTVTSVSVVGNKIYMGLNHGRTGDIMVLSAADLTPLSSGVASGEGVTAPPYVVGADMYVGTLAGNFYKLNSSNSSVDLTFGTGGKVAVGESLPTSAFYNNGAFYAGSTKGKVWKIGLDGTLSKTYDTWNPSAVVGGVVVERASNTLAFGTSAGDFYKVPLSGGDAGIFGPNLGFETTPTYDSSTGRFFIGSNDGSVYGF